MKDATGEMSMTVVVIILVALILTFATTFLWPKLKGIIEKKVEPMEDAYVEVIDNYNV